MVLVKMGWNEGFDFSLPQRSLLTWRVWMLTAFFFCVLLCTLKMGSAIDKAAERINVALYFPCTELRVYTGTVEG